MNWYLNLEFSINPTVTPHSDSLVYPQSIFAICSDLHWKIKSQRWDFSTRRLYLKLEATQNGYTSEINNIIKAIENLPTITRHILTTSSKV